MQRTPPCSLRPRNSEAQRCGQRWSITPTRPALLRKPISFSPSSISLSGGPSLRRPPPRICSAPTRKAQARPRSCQCAVARTVAHPAEVEVLQRTGGTDPVADLAASRIELIARQLLQCARIFVTQRSDDFAVQRLIDGEVTQSARRHNPNAQRFGLVFDCLTDGPAEPIAAARRGLVGWVVGVEGRNEMGRKPGMHRIVPSLRILVVARRRAMRPRWPLLPTRRRLARAVRDVCDRLAAIDEHTRHEVVVIDFLLVTASRAAAASS